MNLLKIGYAGGAGGPQGKRRSHAAGGVARRYVRKGQVLSREDQRSDKTCLDIEDITESWPTAPIRPSCWTSGRAGTPFRRPCARISRASSSSRTRARASWASRTRARCGARSTTCRPTISPRSSTACGIRCGRCIFRCTPTCARSCTRNTATWCPRTVRFRRICWATCGRRTGPTSTSWSRPRTPIPATT